MSELAFVHKFVPGKSGRVILALHGTGGDENDLVPLAQMLDPEAAVLSPRGRVNEGGALRFFRRFAEGVFDQEDMKLQTEALAEFVEQASAQYGFDLRNVMALGFSNGANIAASLLLRKPEVLAGGILLRAMVPFVPDVPPDLHSKRIFLANGRSDTMIPSENAAQLYEMLRTYGAEVEQLWLNTGHNLTREEIDRAKAWLESNVAA